MKQGSEQGVFLNQQGVQALEHLSGLWLDGRFLRCRRITNQGSFIEVVAMATARPDDQDVDVHLLVPAHFIDLVVLDELS